VHDTVTALDVRLGGEPSALLGGRSKGGAVVEVVSHLMGNLRCKDLRVGEVWVRAHRLVGFDEFTTSARDAC